MDPPPRLLPESNDSHRLPVTALAFAGDNLILSGEGSFLCFNSVHNHSQYSRCRIFEKQVIHGIVVRASTDLSSHVVIVYGGHLVSIIRLEQHSNSVITAATLALLATDDWILAAAAPCKQLPDSEECLAFITAHDALWLLRQESAPLTWTLSPVVPGSNTILYSAHAVWESPTTLLVASGTAFGDVVLWSCHDINSADHNPSKTIHYNFSAHEGSLFGIRISDSALPGLSEKHSRLVATSSDDRTIRLWDISNLHKHDATQVEQERSTGFGSEATQHVPTPPLLAKIMAHLSRIWSVRFVQNPDELCQLRSFGEDAHVMTWSFEASGPAAESPFTMSKVSSLHTHVGKNIWSIGESTSGLLATGGADGAISILHPRTLSISTTIALPHDESNRLGSAEDLYKSYALLDDHTFFAVTKAGRVCLADLGRNIESNVVSHEPSLAKHSIVAAVQGAVFICGAHSDIWFIVSPDCAGKLSLPMHRPTALLACVPTRAHQNDLNLYSRSRASPQNVVLLANAAGGIYYLLFLDWNDSARTYEVSHKLMKEGLTQHSPTSLVCNIDIEGTVSIMIGTRAGALLQLIATKNGLDAGIVSELDFMEVHKDAVTAMLWRVPGYGAAPSNRGHLFTTSRDGSLAIFTVQNNQHSPVPNLRRTLTKVHHLQLPFGPNIEGLAVLGNNDLLVWGFRNKHFVSHSLSRNMELMAIDCGGVHRSWTFYPQLNGGRFVWTQASQVRSVFQSELAFDKINGDSHGREIKALASFRRSDGKVMLATGAEDTCIRLFVIEPGPIDGYSHLRCTNVIRKHTTGPQQLAFSECGQYLFSSGGYMEFYIWRVHDDCPVLGTGVFCESRHPECGTSDLRITSFAVQTESARPDRQDEKRFKICMTYSDSSVAMWTYAAKDADVGWVRIDAADYLTACPTHVHLNDTVDGHFVTSATDGHLTFWQHDNLRPSSLAWHQRHQIHQSAVLCMAVVDLPDGTKLYITGGDDNAITCTRGHPDKDEVISTTVRDAHAAAVTAMLAVPLHGHSKPTCSAIISVGLDQRLIVWKLAVDQFLEKWTMQKQSTTHINVADACGIEFLGRVAGNRIQVVIAGIGIQMVTLVVA